MAKAYKFKNFKITAADEPLIAKLKPRYRSALNDPRQDHVVSGEDGIPLGTVKSRLHRARTALQILRDAVPLDAG